MPEPMENHPFFNAKGADYYGLPQRGQGSGGQIVGIPAPGGGVLSGNAPIPQPGLPAGISIQSATMPPPWNEPPPSAISLDQTVTTVLTVPSGGNAAAIAGATQLAAATSALSGTTVVTTQQSATGTPVAIITYNPTTYGVFNGFGVWVSSSQGRQAVQVQIQVNGNPSPGLAESAADNFYGIESPVQVFVPFSPNDTVTIKCRNLDANSGYLLRARLKGWRYS